MVLTKSELEIMDVFWATEQPLSRADLLEQSEIKAWELLHLFDSSIPVPRVVYNREFAVRELDKSIAGLLQLSELPSGNSFKQSVNKAAVELLASLAPMPEQEKCALLEEAETLKSF